MQTGGTNIRVNIKSLGLALQKRNMQIFVISKSSYWRTCLNPLLAMEYLFRVFVRITLRHQEVLKSV